MSKIDNSKLNEIRKRMQESLSKAKKDKLHTDYGMQFEQTASSLSPDEENEWLDDVLEFERQFEQAKTTTVRERIGNPQIKPLSALPLYSITSQHLRHLRELLDVDRAD